MKLKNYIHLDKVINKYIVVIFSFIFKSKKKIIRKDSNIENILIIKFLGIGSISRSLGMINHLQNLYPESKISFLTFKENESFMKIIKPLDDYYLIDKSNIIFLIIDFFKTLMLFKKKNCLVIDLEVHSYFAKLFCFFINSKSKLGFYLKEKISFYDNLFYFDNKIFIEENYYKILYHLKDKNYQKVNILSLLKLNESELSLEQKLKRIGINKNEKFFVININTSDLCEERKWDIDNFNKLIKKILKKDYKIILIGSNSEKASINKLFHDLDENNPNFINFAGKTDIGELFCILKNYKNVFITCDTGPLHIANISKCATISLWGPGTPVSYGENYENHKIIYKNVHCSPCIYIHVDAPCNGNNICMKNITVDEVFEQSLELINKI